MRLHLTLPGIEAQAFTPPERCPYDDCHSTRLRLHQEVTKPVRDTYYEHVTARRYQCLDCKRTFRVYPNGVNSAPTSARVKRLGVLLYQLGLSYRSVSQALEAFGVYLCASGVYAAVQASARQGTLAPRQSIFEGVKVFNNGSTITKLKYQGKWLPFRLDLSKPDELALVVDELTDEQAQALAARIGPLAPTRLTEETPAEGTGVPLTVAALDELRDVEPLARTEPAETGEPAVIPTGSSTAQLAGESWQA
jgi:hypothetical protein